MRVYHKPHPIRPERAEALSPGQRPCFCQHYPGRCPGLRAFGLSARPLLSLFRLVTHPHCNQRSLIKNGILRIFQEQLLDTGILKFYSSLRILALTFNLTNNAYPETLMLYLATFLQSTERRTG